MGIVRLPWNFWRRRRRIILLSILALPVIATGGVLLWHFGYLPPTGQSLPSIDSPQAKDRIVVFAPHPDDETLGAGGYLLRAVAAGARVRIVLITNGEYGRTGIDHLPELPAERASGYKNFAVIRQQETLMALGALGVPQSAVIFLCYPNHLLERMIQPANWLPRHPVFDARLNTTRIPFTDAFSPGAPYCGAALLRDVETVLLREKPTVVITLHPNDIHPDHWATSAITQYAINELADEGYPFARNCRVYGYLIHRGLWPRPKQYFPRLPLAPPPSLAKLSDWRQLPLTHRQTRLLGEAIALFQSQGGATHPFMRSFIRANGLYALISDHTWPVAAVVPSCVLIRDPDADFRQGSRYPSADIQNVAFARKDQELIVTITTRKPATAGTRFFLSIISGGKSDTARGLTELQWQRGEASGRMMARGKLSSLPRQSLRSAVTGRTATLHARWPLVEEETTFFLLQAWSSENQRPADATAATVLRIAGN